MPAWQKRGSGLYWQEKDKEGFNPITGEKVLTVRYCLKRDMELPMKDDYSRFICGIVEQDHAATATSDRNRANEK